jgi:hypothetical protein
MIESLLFLMMMVAFAWLVHWSVADRSKTKNWWSPFDWKETKEGETKGTMFSGQRAPPAPPWKRGR